jgi:queuine/archaeosine tRNA-ribosyltransferase
VRNAGFRVLLVVVGGRKNQETNHSPHPIEQECNCDLCDNMNTKKDPAITRKDEDEDEDAALGLGF